jgi:hypothetical protein
VRLPSPSLHFSLSSFLNFFISSFLCGDDGRPFWRSQFAISTVAPMRNLLLAFLVAAPGVSPLPALAQKPVDVARETEALRSRIDHLESLVDQLRAETGSHRRQTVNEPLNAATARLSGERDYGDGVEHASFETWNLTSALSSPPDSYPSVRLTGFFQADVGWVHQDSANMAAVGDAQDGTEFRRARLAATGNVAENVGYGGSPAFALRSIRLRAT